MMTSQWAEFTESVALAARELRAQKLGVTPGHVETLLNAVNARAQDGPRFMPPKPYWLAANQDALPPGALTPAQATELEAERDTLIAELDTMPYLDRVRAEHRVLEIERQLHRNRLGREAARRDAERESERQAQRGEMSRPTEAEVKAELSRPENKNVLAVLNEETGEVRSFIVPRERK